MATIKVMGRDVEIPDPEPTPEAAAWADNVRSGWGANAGAELRRAADEIAESNRIAAMDMDQYAAERKRLGLSRDLGQFLSGN
jgi:hypothetical protein